MFREGGLLVLLAAHASAMVFKGPQPTSEPERAHFAVPPAPTVGPELRLDLIRRSNVMTDLIAPDNTCGFISGLAGAAYTCNPYTDLCAFFPGTASVPGFIGCCDPDTFNCGARVTCVDHSQFYTGSVCDNGCVKDTFTLKCTATSAPYCNIISFPAQSVADFFCDQNYVSTPQLASTNYIGAVNNRVFTPITVTPSSSGGSTGAVASSSKVSLSPPNSSSSSAASTATTAPGPVGSGTPTGTTGAPGSGTVAPATSSSATVAPSSSGSSTPVAAIAGGAAGGVVFIAAVVGLIFFLLRRNKNKNKPADAAAANANAAIPPPTYAPPPDQNNNSAYAAAGAGKPGPTTQETAVPMQYAPPGGQYPQAPNQYQQVPPQQQYPPPVQQQQQLYTPMAEVDGSGGQYQQQNLAPGGYYNPNPPNQSPQTYYSQTASPGQVSPNSQAHLSGAFPDRNDTTSPLSQDHRRVSELGTPSVPEAPNSPAPTFASHGAGPGGVAPRPYAEMSANMAGGQFPINLHDGTYEVPGSVPPRQ